MLGVEPSVSAGGKGRHLRIALPLAALVLALAIGALVLAGRDQSDPSPTSSGDQIYSDTEPHVSPEDIELSRLVAAGKHSEPKVGDQIEVSFSLKNVGADSVTFDETFIAARDPDDGDQDFGSENAGRVVAAGDEVEVSRSVVVDAAGDWRFWPCYYVSAGGESIECPDEWRSFDVSVAKPAR